MTKYLFLDIDGVLNSERSVAAFGKLTHAGRVKDDMLDGKTPDPMWDTLAVQMLKNAQAIIGFKLVISSTWRQKFSLVEFHQIFDLYDWDTRDIIVGKTGDESGIRGNQIKAWLDSHGKYPYEYVIVDDGTDMLEGQLDRFIKTSFENGFCYDCYTQLFRLFNVEYTPVGIT